MPTVEKEGKTVEEAVRAACSELGIDPKETTVEVLQEPKGILGVTTRKALVRVSAPENGGDAKEPEKKDDLENLKFRRAESPDEGAVAGKGDSTPEKPPRRPDVSERPVLDPDFDPANALETVCRFIDPEATVSPRREQDRLVLSISCNGSGIFIGHRGQTLDAMQYLINRMAGKQNPRIGRIVVDSEGYRERKKARLVDDAWTMAREAKKGDKPVVSEPLSAFDRRIIHTTLRDDDGVTTRSLGEGEFKRVQVLPTNAR